MNIKCDGLTAQGEALPKISYQPTKLLSWCRLPNDGEPIMSTTSQESYLPDGGEKGNKSGVQEANPKNKQGDHCGVASHCSLLAATNDESHHTEIISPIVASVNNTHQAVCQTSIHCQLALCVVPFEQTSVQQLDALERIEDARQCDDGLASFNRKLAVLRVIAGGQ